MDENVKVSIVTVSYNSVATIEQTIRSVLNQTYKNIEYILIDGNSTDGTKDVILKYKDSIATFISEPDEGIYDAMNKGIRQATGDIVGIINSDDWYETDAVEKVVYNFEKNNAELIYGTMWNISENGMRTLSKPVFQNQLWWEMIPHPTVFMKRYIYEKYGGFNIKYKIVADYDLIIRLYIDGIKFMYINEIIANFRLGGISTRNKLACAEEVRQVSLCYASQYYGRDDIVSKINQVYNDKIFDIKCREDERFLYDLLCKRMVTLEKEIVIFGSGVWGQRCYEMLRSCNIKICFFVDNNKDKWGTELKDIKVVSPVVLKNYAGNVLVAVKGHDEEIAEQLAGYHNEGINWISIDELIKEM